MHLKRVGDFHPVRIDSFVLHPYEFFFQSGRRRGVLIHLIDEKGTRASGDVAPLPGWSRETLEESIAELNEKKQDIIDINWSSDSCFEDLAKLNLLPSVMFGLESALLSILDPLPEFTPLVSAFLMGSPDQILELAKLRQSEGFTSAKLKVSHLSFSEAAQVIYALKDRFRLRIDVNRVWETEEALRFFAQFPLDAFDYVEEPFKNPHDLRVFTHPLAVDESFPQNLSLSDLESLPTLRALVYKPTIQGGMVKALPLRDWTKKRGISLVLSSSYESDVGHAHIACMAYRLKLLAPVGIGTRLICNDFA